MTPKKRKDYFLYRIIKSPVRLFTPKMELTGVEHRPDGPAIIVSSTVPSPVCFNPDAPMDEERSRIREYLMESITGLACSMPEHTVIPYRNIPKKEYPSNIPAKEAAYEKTGG